jgi:hypothetical protein
VLCESTDDTVSDVTPNGSLRRRRSRVPSEEDDSNLMDFLRSSGHDGSRERKSWGSLGNDYTCTPSLFLQSPGMIVGICKSPGAVLVMITCAHRLSSCSHQV